MKIVHLFSLLCVVLCAGACHAAQYGVSLEKDKLAAGELVEVSLFWLNSDVGESTSLTIFPREIVCELKGEGEEIAVPCERVPREMAQIGSVKEHYSFRLPPQLEGQLILTFKELDAPRIVLDVSQKLKAAEESPGGQLADAPEEVFTSLDSLFSLYQPYRNNVSAYEPVYFLVGADPENSKFQISFKYKFFNTESLFAESYPWLEGLHFGYTQTSFWDLASASAPFDDTSYKPEFFWLSRNYLSSAHGFFKGVFLQGGFQHESNGKGADDSRSTNYLYVKPTLIFYDDNSKWGMQISPKFWTYVHNEETTNDDLPDYRGYFDLETKFGLTESFVAGTHLRWADEGVSFQFDISYPLHNIFGNALDVYLYAQYSNKLAESLIDYQERTQSFRLGLAFIR